MTEKILRRVAPQYDKAGGRQQTTEYRPQTTENRFTAKDHSFLQGRNNIASL